jgi:hypothetical protein
MRKLVKSGIITGLASIIILFEGCLDNLIPRDKPTNPYAVENRIQEQENNQENKQGQGKVRIIYIETPEPYVCSLTRKLLSLYPPKPLPQKPFPRKPRQL